MPVTCTLAIRLRLRFWRQLCLPLALLLAGCSQIATVKQHEAAYVASGSAELSNAESQLAAAHRFENSEPLKALGGYLAVADDAANLLKRDPHNSAALRTYNYAVGRSVEIICNDHFNPWHQPLTAAGPQKTYTVTGVLHSE